MGVGVLAAVSTVVAFNGWPGASRGGGATPSAMLAQSAPAPVVERVTTAPSIVVPEAPSRRRRTSSAARPVDTPGETGSVRVAPDTTSDTGPGSGSAPGRKVHGTATTPKVPPVPPTSVTAPVRKAGADLGNSTDQTVSDLGKAVEPISPTLSNAVGDVGQVVGDTVQGVTNTLSDVLDSVLTKPSP